MSPRKKKTVRSNAPSMFINLNGVLDQVGRDKGIPKEILIEAIESAMLSAARKRYSPSVELEAHYNEDLGEVELFQFREVVDVVEDPDMQILYQDALKLDPDTTVGDSLGEKIDSEQFGRIAAQTAKQVIIQRIRDAERDLLYEEYKDRIGEVVTGIVRRNEKGNLIVDLGRTEAVLPVKEQIPTETYKINDRLQAYLLDIRRDQKVFPLLLSRRHPKFIKALFALEVPEISDGIVEIKGVAREPGSRSKIAVYSQDADVDPVGACVGMRGARVQNVVQELRGEKIDIVPYEEDPARFVCNAIAPADVSKVLIHEKALTMEVIVPDDQLSLAIGKKGQNVRLAAQLTGWNIDILSESKLDEMQKKAKESLAYQLDIEDSLASLLYSHAFRSVDDIAGISWEEFLEDLPGLNADLLKEIYQKAKVAMRSPKPPKQVVESSMANLNLTQSVQSVEKNESQDVETKE